jgi:2-iminobutanoate/2-iminopropanoate deaminase
MIRVGNLIWGSALAGVNPSTGVLVGETAYEQTAQALKLIAQMLEEIESGLSQVVSVTVFLKDVADFAEMNHAYIEAFGTHEPTRSVVSVVDLPKAGALLTLNFVAVNKVG